MELGTLQSKVKVWDGTEIILINADGSINSVVSATDLDIRDLSSAQDDVSVTTVKPDGTNTMPSLDTVARPGFVKLTNGTETAAIDSNGNIGVVPTDHTNEQILTDILKQLKIMNLHLTILTDNDIKKTEVE